MDRKNFFSALTAFYKTFSTISSIKTKNGYINGAKQINYVLKDKVKSKQVSLREKTDKCFYIFSVLS